MSLSDPRQPLLDLLSEYNPTDLQQEETRQRFIRFVKTNDNALRRELMIGHVTGSALITNASRDSLVLVHHKKLGIWLQPGGHADGESNLLKVTTEEAEEETGLQSLRVVSDSIFDLDIHRIPPYRNTPEHHHYDVRFLLEADPAEELSRSDESYDLSWVGFAEVPEFTREESILRMIRKIESNH